MRRRGSCHGRQRLEWGAEEGVRRRGSGSRRGRARGRSGEVLQIGHARIQRRVVGEAAIAICSKSGDLHGGPAETGGCVREGTGRREGGWRRSRAEGRRVRRVGSPAAFAGSRKAQGRGEALDRGAPLDPIERGCGHRGREAGGLPAAVAWFVARAGSGCKGVDCFLFLDSGVCITFVSQVSS